MKISVIIPVYNASKTIERTLDSVINQTIKPFEIILINDGSKDNSLKIIENYTKLNPANNFIIISKINGGVSSARNAGLKIASGDFIALLDSDDEWFLDKSEKQLEVFKDNLEIGFLGGLIFKPKNSDKAKLREITLSNLIFKNYFQPSTVMFRKEVVDKIGLFDESQRYAEEGNYFMRVAKEFNCFLLNKQIVIYDQGKSSFGKSGLSANLKEMEKGELKNLKFAYRQGYISFCKYFFAVIFSILKYIKRILVVNLRE